MPTDFLIYDPKNYPQSQITKDKDDLLNIQILRGRFLHYMSIIENIMKETSQLTGHNLTFYQVYPRFAKIIKANSTQYNLNSSEVKTLLDNLQKINKQRNKWAHAIIYYKRRKTKSVNNLIGKSPLSIYFVSINKRFNIIINLLKKSNLWRINGLNIYKHIAP